MPVFCFRSLVEERMFESDPGSFEIQQLNRGGTVDGLKQGEGFFPPKRFYAAGIFFKET